MASLNLSINGPSIKSSYQGVVNGDVPPGSSTSARWALFTVQAPLLNAFQDGGAKESILKVEGTGDGDLTELIEDFSEGRMQFAFVKVKDPNTALPKNVLIAWCGGGVPERTKGYFTSHLSAVTKVLHGYHVQITARSDADLEPQSIMQKVSDASGAKYTAGGSAPLASSAPPPLAKKPVFTPTTSGAGSSFNPLVAARSRRTGGGDDDGWGDDAPPVTRTELQKVESAYKPTKVNMAELTKGRNESTSSNGFQRSDDRPNDVIGGGYQPVGKIDIAAIRAQANYKQDDRPTLVKGSYEPVGKVDINAIRSKAQRPSEPEPTRDDQEPPRSLADRSAAFSKPAQSERLTSMPKPKVASKFSGASSFMGTKPPAPGNTGGLTGAPASAGPGLGSAGRSFAESAGKTPAQIWAEKKAREGGSVPVSTPLSPGADPITAQKSGSEWKSGYSGKSWAPIQTGAYGRGIPGQKTGDDDDAAGGEEPASPGGGISALRDRFKGAAPMGGVAPGAPRVPAAAQDDYDSAPPPLPSSGRPSGGFALPGLPSRPPEDDDDEEEAAPSIPTRNYEEERDESPVRVAIPVPRGPEPDLEPPAERFPPRPLPTQEIEEELPREEDLPAEEEAHDPRAAAAAVAAQTFQHAPEPAAPAAAGGKRAVIQYDYEKAEDNELELVEGEYVTNIEMVDDDWWMGTNSKGESGLFPSNYVELVEDDDEAGGPAASQMAAPPPPPPAAEPEPEPEHHAAAAGGGGGATASALYDYEAAEDNELSFPEGATITDLEFPDEDWWFGHYGGKSGLFPANYVERD